MITNQSIIDRFEAKYIPEPNSGCYLWDACYQGNYGYFWIDNEFGYEGAHRAAWIIYKGRIPKKLWVLHHCDNPSCVNLKHLFLGTALWNMYDSLGKGRKPVGERVTRAKLTDEQARSILLDCRSGLDIAKDYSVGKHVIYDLKLGRSYKYL